jgi:CRP/FNR family cyclic AMP-dependent transcriptional regulator
MAEPSEISERLRSVAQAAEKSRLTAEADELYRLAFEIETVSRHRAASARDASLAKLARVLKDEKTAADLAGRSEDAALMGLLSLESLDLEAARRALDRARAENPFDAEAASWRGRLNFLERLFPEALADLLEAEWLRHAGAVDPVATRHLRAVRALLNLDAGRVRQAAEEAYGRLVEKAREAGAHFPATGRLSEIVKRVTAHGNGATGGALERARRLRSLSTFSGLDDRALFEIATFAETRRVRLGERLYAGDEAALGFFLVVEGRVAVSHDTPVGSQALGVASAGDFFGVAEALMQEKRPAAAAALEESQVFSFVADGFFTHEESVPLVQVLRQHLAKYLRFLNDEFKSFFSATAPGVIAPAPALPQDTRIPKEEKAKLLSKGGLSPADLALFASFCSEKVYGDEAVIFREGDPGEALYIVARGKVRISRQIPGAGEEALAILEPGAIFGEMAIFDPEEKGRSADAYSLGGCALLRLDRRILETMEASDPESIVDLSALLCRVAAQRILETTDRLVQWRILAGNF